MICMCFRFACMINQPRLLILWDLWRVDKFFRATEEHLCVKFTEILSDDSSYQIAPSNCRFVIRSGPGVCASGIF